MKSIPTYKLNLCYDFIANENMYRIYIYVLCVLLYQYVELYIHYKLLTVAITKLGFIGACSIYADSNQFYHLTGVLVIAI